MAYQERRMSPHGRLQVDGEDYDIDSFGMDDGQNRDPDATFRFLFQLGQGFMIYRYVLCAMQPGDDRWFHTFWTKDCAVAEVDEEEHGPPAGVRAEGVRLPRVYRVFRLEHGPGEDARDFDLAAVTFDAAYGDNAGTLLVRFDLHDAEGQPATLTWSLADRWRLSEAGRAVRALTAPERVTFAEVLP